MPEIKKSKFIKLTKFNKIIGLNELKENLFIKDGIIISQNEQSYLNNSIDWLNIDAKDCIISPGFIDPQVNGLDKCNFWSKSLPDFSDIDELRLKLASSGVVAFCPTLITAPVDNLIRSIDHLNSYIEKNKNNAGAKILGIHIEGVFITKYGVHNPDYVIKDLTVKNLQPFIKPNVCLFTIAPELDKTGGAIILLQENKILVSIGHSNASYREGAIYIKKYNLHSVTHMFNSLKGVDGFSHRGENLNIELLQSKLEDERNINPDQDGIMLAALKNKDVLCMVISDGIHVNKKAISLLKDFKDKNHFALVSDLVSKDFYELAASKGALGGGQNALDKCISNLIKWKVSDIEDCLTFASRPIANQLKEAQELGLGHISFKKEANIVFWDTTKNAVKGTIIGENVFLNY